jgi:PAS domain S-box-containing protein
MTNYKKTDEQQKLLAEVKDLRIKLAEAEEIVHGIRSGGVDSVVVSGGLGEQVFMLKGEEHAYRVLVESMNEGAAMLAADSTILYCNSNLASLVKTPLEKLTGTPFRSLITPSSLPLFEAVFRKSLDSSGKGELILMAGDGTDVPVYFSASTMKDNDNSIVCAVVTNLTKQKSDQAIVTSGRLASAILEQAGEIILVCDETGHIIRTSQMAKQILGICSLQEYFDEVLPLRKDNDGQLFSISETLRGDIQQQLEVTLDRRDGKNLVFLLSSCPLRNEEGGVIGSVTTLVDFTERKKAEEALKESEERYRTLFESTVEGILITDGATRQFKYANPAICKMLGYSQEELTKLSVMDIHPEDELKRILAVFSDQTMEENPISFGFPCLKKDGTIVYADINGTKTPIDGKECHIGFFTDATERKQAEAQTIELETLKRTNQAKSELLANVSHELRTPLASIKGNIETLLETDVKWSRTQQLEFLDEANTQADRLTSMIRDLLDMSRIDAGKLTLDKRSCQVKEILDAASGVLRVITAKHKLEIAFLPEMPPLLADKSRIVQVITNLAENATKFSPEGSRIEIAAAFKADCIIISVQDHGPGMPQEVYQAKEVASGKTRGTGLGLTICKGIVEAHGGKIWVESEEDKGSKFSFSIPVIN